MKYDSETRTFTIYSEDMDLLGFRDITLSAHLTDYPSMKSQTPDVATQIEILEYFGPCAFITLTTPEQSNPSDYFYTEMGLSFTLVPFSID